MIGKRVAPNARSGAVMQPLLGRYVVRMGLRFRVRLVEDRLVRCRVLRFRPVLKGTRMTHSTNLNVFNDDVFTDAELRTLAGFLGGYSGLPETRTRSISASSPNGATTVEPACSP